MTGRPRLRAKGLVIALSALYVTAVVLLVVKKSDDFTNYSFSQNDEEATEWPPKISDIHEKPKNIQNPEKFRTNSRKTHEIDGATFVPAAARNPITKNKLYSSQEEIVNKNTTSSDVDSCIKSHVGATGGFCLDENNVFDGYNYIWDGLLCAGLEDLFGQNATVADFGAGLGNYGRCFLRVGNNVIRTRNNDERAVQTIAYEFEMEKANLFEEPQVIKSWKGFDGALNIEPLSQGFIKYLDLSKEQDLGERFDWVMSVEVGEHIPHEYETVFLENLVRHACKGLVLTWSSEIGKGHFHVNIHPREYIIDRVVKMGLKHDPVAQETLTETISLDYIKKGLMVFRVDPMKC